MADFYSGWRTPPNGKAAYRLHMRVNLLWQNVNTNQSGVSIEMWLEKDRSFQGFYAYPGASVENNVDGHEGVNYSGTFPNAPWNGWSSYPFGIGSATIDHNADGSKHVSVHGQWRKSATGWAIGDLTIDDGMDLPTIPRATQPTVAPSPATTGSQVVVGLPAASGAFTHDVTWSSGALSGTIATGVSGNQTWTVPDVSSQWAGRTRFPITINVVTKSGGVAIGSKQTLLQSRPAPTPPGPIDPNVGSTVKQFDIRARLVKYDGGGWFARQTLPTASLSLVDSSSATATCSLSLSKLNAVGFDDYSIVDVDVFNGTDWIFTNHRFVLTRTQDDATDATQTGTYSGTEFIDFELGMLYSQTDYYWDGATNHWGPTSPGNILATIINDAKARGWGPRIKIEFDGSLTSLGDPWANASVSRTVSAGTPASQVLSGLVSDGLVEYRTEYRADGFAYLILLNPGTGQDFSADQSSPVVNLKLAELTSAPRQATIETKINAVTVAGDVPAGAAAGAANRIGRAQSPDDSNVFGRLEGWVSASGVTDGNALAAIGDNALRDNGVATNQRTFAYNAQNAKPQFFPYAVFVTGDWVLRPDTSGTLKDRIAQVTIAKTLDSFTITVATGDRILGGTASIAKRQQAQTGGAIAGGNQSAPASLDSMIPKAPTGIEVSGAGYWASDGSPKSSVTLSWAPVVSALNNGNLQIDQYEIWWRPAAEDEEWKLSTTTADTTITIPGWDVQDAIELRIRAESAAGVYGEFSEDQDWTNLSPATNLDGPRLSNLYTDGIGGIYAVWDGLLGSSGGGSGFGTGGYGTGGYGVGGSGSAAPNRLAYVAAEVSSDGGATYVQMGTPIVAPGSIVIQPGAYGDYLVRLRPYDKLGNPGTASAPQAISLIDPHINPPIPNAPTGLTATPGAAWSASGILPEAWFDLNWSAPTTDVDGAPVSVAGYDIYGQKAGETIQRYLTTSATNSVRIEVANNETWTFQVKAVSSYSGVSDFSDAVTATANAAISIAAAPTAPVLTQYAGILQIQWSGGGMLPQIKNVYASISSTSGGTYTRVGQQILGAGEVDVPGLAPGDYYAKITMVDELGNSSTSPASAKLTLLPITGVTIQTSELANTGIKMTTGGITAYNAAGQPTFTLNANTGEVWIAPYAAVIDLGATGDVATTGAPTTGIAISAENSDFNTFIHPSGLQIRRGQNALSWWEADASDASLVNFFSPRAVIGQRLLVGDYEYVREAKTTGSRLVIRYKGA